MDLIVGSVHNHGINAGTQQDIVRAPAGAAADWPTFALNGLLFPWPRPRRRRWLGWR